MNPNTHLLSIATAAATASSTYCARAIPPRSEAEIQFLRDALHSIQGIEEHHKNLVSLLAMIGNGSASDNAELRLHVLQSIDDDVEQFDNAFSYVKKRYHMSLMPILENEAQSFTEEEVKTAWHIFSNCSQNHPKNQEVFLLDGTLSSLLRLSTPERDRAIPRFESLLALGSICRGSEKGFLSLVETETFFPGVLLQCLSNGEALGDCERRRLAVAALRLLMDASCCVGICKAEKVVTQVCHNGLMREVMERLQKDPTDGMDDVYSVQDLFQTFLLGMSRLGLQEQGGTNAQAKISIQQSIAFVLTGSTVLPWTACIDTLRNIICVLQDSNEAFRLNDGEAMLDNLQALNDALAVRS